MKLRTFLVSLLLTVTCMLGFSTGIVHADNLEAKGVDKDSAVITDAQGNVQSHTKDLTESGYHVSWHWSIPDQVKIKSGDTMQIEVPDNVVIPHSLTFDILNSTGLVVGQANFMANANTGTVTFNDQLADKTLNRKGDIYIYASGKALDDQLPSDWLINKSGWWDTNKHDKINWNIALNPDQSDLGHVTLSDTLGPHQTYLPGSVVAQTGTWDAQGQFTPDGGTVPVKVTQKSDRKLQFDLPHVTTGVNLQYQTQATGNPNGETYTNAVTLDADKLGGGEDDTPERSQSNAQLSFGGGGTGDGDMDVKPEVPDQPSQPDQPTTPKTPEQPKTPDEPTTPKQPETPKQPDTPKQPTAPKVTDKNKTPHPKRDAETKQRTHTTESSPSSAKTPQTHANKQRQHQLPLTDVATFSIISLIGLALLALTGTLYFKSHK
ncbi:hypothetical protein D3P96_06610 [Weissella viridescens]|uniref:Outer membrane protein n=1 Tax=Weissella viridescens TaxID=1629 RepID=A0A3P2RFM2_WEIVI|nr:collagen binding domain-containing protein [Weissella viridescens]RRG17620.1 hypothetical protein D3P96_06610 [Weissella viridescens]